MRVVHRLPPTVLIVALAIGSCQQAPSATALPQTPPQPSADEWKRPAEIQDNISVECLLRRGQLEARVFSDAAPSSSQAGGQARIGGHCPWRPRYGGVSALLCECLDRSCYPGRVPRGPVGCFL